MEQYQFVEKLIVADPVKFTTSLGTFANLRKTAVSFMSVCSHGTTRLPMDEF
jgi:hypothetical protein